MKSEYTCSSFLYANYLISDAWFFLKLEFYFFSDLSVLNAIHDCCAFQISWIGYCIQYSSLCVGIFYIVYGTCTCSDQTILVIGSVLNIAEIFIITFDNYCILSIEWFSM